MRRKIVKKVLSVILSVQLALSGGITVFAERTAENKDSGTYQAETKTYVPGERIREVTASSFQEGYGPEKAVDGIEDDPNNCWHTPWSENAPTFPHWIQVEFDEPQLIDSLEYVARSASGFQFVTKYEIWTSETTEAEDLEKVTEGSWERSKIAKAEFNPVSATLVRFVAKEKVDSSSADTYSVSASEIKFGLSSTEEGAHDEKIQAALDSAQRVVNHALTDKGTGQYQFKQGAVDSVRREMSELEALLGTGDVSAINTRIAALESAKTELLSSNKTDDEALTAAVPSGALRASANSQNAGYEAEKAVDGTTSTIWHTQWEPAVTKRPHDLTIDLGQSILLNKITIIPRQDMKNGRISSGEVYVGNTTENMVLAASFAAENTTDVALSCQEARYIQIRSLSGPDDHTAIAEVMVDTYDRGYAVLVNAYEEGMGVLNNAQMGDEVGQYPQDAVDEFRSVLDGIPTEMEKPLTNSACYEIAERVQEARENFAGKIRLYRLWDLKDMIQEAEKLLKELKNELDIKVLDDAVSHAKEVADNPKSTPAEIHEETVTLKASVEGLRVSGEDRLNLSGKWDFALRAYQKDANLADNVSLPGTLDENKKGNYNAFRDTRRLSRYYTYTGPASFRRQVFIPNSWEGRQVTLFMERSRETKVWVNDKEVLAPDSSNLLAVSQTYDLTQEIQFGQLNTITIQVDNSYPNSPGAAITYSSMATEETQTNWNGIVGVFELRTEKLVNINDLRVYPNEDLQSASVEVEIKNGTDEEYSGQVTIQAKGLSGRQIPVTAKPGEIVTVSVSDYDMGSDVRLWSEFEQNLYTMTAALDNECKVEEEFGMRVFGIDQETKQLSNNGKKVFLRNEANCAVFPLTAYAPMDDAGWEKLFSTYQSYGLNSVRFHSWCPPEAAFRVADRMGMYLQPELSCWDPGSMFGDTNEKDYYTREAKAIMREYANHPSFVMFTFGNELHFAGGGYEYADTLIQELKVQDSTRLYSFASNGDYGGTAATANSDFFTGQTYRGTTMRGIYAGMSGFINQSRPATVANYNEAVKRAADEAGLPAFSFEVGQFQVFPDVLEELDDYTGVLEPRNLQIVEERLQEKNISEETTKKWIDASGMLSRIAYRMEIEAALRTEHMSGISLLGIQDFSGQSTALVGMMNALGDPKPYDFAKPSEFSTFFSPEVALLETEKFTWTNAEELKGKLLLANYGSEDQTGEMFYCLKDGDTVIEEGTVGDSSFPQGNVTQAGEISIPLDKITEPSQLKLTIGLGEVKNNYDIWVYPAEEKAPERDVYVTEFLDEEALYLLEEGGKVLLSPKVNKSTLPDSITGTFTTAFWSSQFVSESQPGSMGLLMDPEHPVFDGFPTEYHSNYQWWAMAKLGRPMVLENFKQEDGTNIQPLIQVLDSFSTVRTMGLLYEAKVGEGKLMVSSMGLDQLQATYPEARALRNSILNYMNSDEFNPGYELSVEQIQKSVIGTETDPRVNVAEKSNGGNVLLKEGIVTCQEGYDNHPQDRKLELNDGRVDVNVSSRSWTDWNRENKYPDVELTALFDKGYTVDTVALPFFEDYGCKAPAEVKVEYLSGDGFSEVGSPSQTTGFTKGTNTISFDPVETTQIRITMKHQKDMAIALSEFIVYEKKIPAERIAVSAEGQATTVRMGETLQMGLTCFPENANDTSVRWSVLDEEGNKSSIAKISMSGILTPLAAGKVTVKASLRSDPAVFGTMDITILPQESQGGVKIELELGDGVPAITLPDETDLIHAVLTEEERQRIEDGEQAVITVKADKLEAEDVTKTDRDAIDEARDKKSAALYLNIEIAKQIGDDAETNVTQTNVPISLTLAIPEELQNEEREFSMLRLHDGTAEVLGDLDMESSTITFETDLFSLYVLAYKDPENPDVPVKTGNLKIMVESEDRHVEGINVRIKGSADTGEAYEKIFQTDAEGSVLIEELPTGTYEVSEVADHNTAAYVIPDSQSVTIMDGETAQVLMENRLIRGGFRVLKTDEDKKPLAGVKFGLYKSDGTKLKEFDTAKDGTYSMDNLPYGGYYLKELKTLKGYQLDEKTLYKFTVERQGELSEITVVNKKITEKPEKEPDKKPDGKPNSPKTGDTTDLGGLLALLGVSLAGAAAGVAVYRKKKRTSR